MKYIDAEKLKVHIQYLIKKDNYELFDVPELLAFIDFLQQEQEQHVIGGQVFGATDVNQLYEGKVYIVSNLVQDTEFGLSVRDKVKMLLIKD